MLGFEYVTVEGTDMPAPLSRRLEYFAIVPLCIFSSFMLHIIGPTTQEEKKIDSLEANLHLHAGKL